MDACARGSEREREGGRGSGRDKDCTPCMIIKTLFTSMFYRAMYYRALEISLRDAQNCYRAIH